MPKPVVGRKVPKPVKVLKPVKGRKVPIPVVLKPVKVPIPGVGRKVPIPPVPKPVKVTVVPKPTVLIPGPVVPKPGPPKPKVPKPGGPKPLVLIPPVPKPVKGPKVPIPGISGRTIIGGVSMGVIEDVDVKPTPGSNTIISFKNPLSSFLITGLGGLSGCSGFGTSTENATILISLESFLVTTASANAALDFIDGGGMSTSTARNCLKLSFPPSSVPTWIPGGLSLSTRGPLPCTLPPSDVTLTL